MQYLAKMRLGEMSFSLSLTVPDDRDFKSVENRATILAKKLGVDLYSLQPLEEAKPQTYQFTATDEEFIHLTTQLEGSSEGSTERYCREQIQIWHNDKPGATQIDFHNAYSFWSKALTLGCKPAEVIVHVDNGVLRAVYSDSDTVKCTAVQTDSDDNEQQVKEADATLARAGKMWSIF